MKRPLVPVALLYVGGILIALLIPVPPLFLLAASLSLAALTVAWAQARLVGLCTLIVLTGWTNLTLCTAILSPHDLRRILGEQADIVTVRGAVRETPTQRVYARGQQESWRTMARVKVTALRRNRQSWQPATGRMAVTTQGILSMTPPSLGLRPPSPRDAGRGQGEGHVLGGSWPVSTASAPSGLSTNLFAGQEVEIAGVAGRPKIADAEGTFDYRAYGARKICTRFCASSGMPCMIGWVELTTVMHKPFATGSVLFEVCLVPSPVP